jgi:putative colanic acid biosynthesis UDP-glucose lipid carrier transferase
VYSSFDYFVQNHYVSLLLYSNITWFIAANMLRTYNIYRVTNSTKLIGDALKLVCFHLLFVGTFIGFSKYYYFSRSFLLFSYGFTAFGVSAWRLTTYSLLKAYRQSGFNYRNVIIIGLGEAGKELAEFLSNNNQFGYRFKGFFDDQEKGDKVIGKLEDIENFCSTNKVDEIYCSISQLSHDSVSNLVEFADNNLIRIKMIPESKGFHYKKIGIDFYDHIPILVLRSLPLDDVINQLIKRIFDIAFSLLVIFTLLWWLLPILAIVIKLNSKGPVFFKQLRSGINNNSFWCYKLRSMSVNKDANKQQAKVGDLRVTKVGAFLRKTSLDELPQFFNVLIGNMSVVGPRPHMIAHTEEYSQIIDKYMVRHFVKPGITGLSQVKGYRGGTDDTIDMRNRIKVDIFYLENWSFLLDLRIIVNTVLNVFKTEKNAY